VKVFLVDGTYELFRQHYGIPEPARDTSTTGAIRGVLNSMLSLIAEGATHLGVATDHIIESFRNDLWPTYKSSAGMPEILLNQFHPLEDGLRAMGVAVWAMTDLEADDALASAAAVAVEDPRVTQVVVCTPDKDMAQLVSDGGPGGSAQVVQLDRRKQTIYDEAAVAEKFGVPPACIPDYLALVGDSADGYPGLRGFGAKSAAAVLRRYGRIEDVPDLEWDGVNARGTPALAARLAAEREQALLFKELATLRVDRAAVGTVDDWEWKGPTDGFAAFCEEIGAEGLADRARQLADQLGL
jgi:5'-3' exonuclease